MTLPSDSIESNSPVAPKPSGWRRIWHGGRAVLETVLLGLFFYLILSTFVVQPFHVEQTSMEPTVNPGEYVLVDKLFAGVLGYHRGDIVVLNIPVSSGFEPAAPLIKRIIATGGERLQIHDGAVFINGVKLDEPYLPAGTETNMSDGANLDVVIPAGSVFVMGDHRSASTDSRVFGAVPVSGIIGHAILRYWPLNRLSPLGTDKTNAP